MTIIEIYLNSLPEDLLILSIENRGLISFPDLTRYKSLKELYCSVNLLSSTPPLPDSLEKLHCSNNNLTSFLYLPKNLIEFNYYNNKLNSLPTNLPQILKNIN